MNAADPPANDDDGRPAAAPAPRLGKCVICGRPEQPGTRPFCSKRCADVDLHRWLGGVYRVPVEPDPENSLDDE